MDQQLCSVLLLLLLAGTAAYGPAAAGRVVVAQTEAVKRRLPSKGPQRRTRTATTAAADTSGKEEHTGLSHRHYSERSSRVPAAAAGRLPGAAGAAHAG